jgi:hypothetical protein
LHGIYVVLFGFYYGLAFAAGASPAACFGLLCGGGGAACAQKAFKKDQS